MPHIATVSPAEASGELAETYGQIQAVLGGVPASLQLTSLSPLLTRNQWEFIGYYIGHPTLSGPLIAFLRFCVSREFQCDYCIGFNGGLLVNRYGWTADQLAAAKRDIDAAPLSEKEKALVRYAVDAVRSAGRVERAELDSLRQLGWSDRDILDALMHAARNMSADIVINAFGLEEETAL